MTTTEDLPRALIMARRALAILEEQAAAGEEGHHDRRRHPQGHQRSESAALRLIGFERDILQPVVEGPVEARHLLRLSFRKEIGDQQPLKGLGIGGHEGKALAHPAPIAVEAIGDRVAAHRVPP